MNNRKVTIGHFAAFFVIMVWGTTFISTKILLQSFTPVEIMFFRLIIGYISLLLVNPQILKTRNYKEEVHFAVAGACGVTLYFIFENMALTYTLASNVAIIVSIAPLFTATLAHLFLEEEKLEKIFIVGFMSAIVGIILISLNGNFILKLNPLGDLLATLAAFVWAFYSILMRKISKFSYNTIQCTRRVFLYGLIFMVPAIFIFDFNFDLYRFKEITNLLHILYLGLGASAICFVMWNWVVGILGAVKTSVYMYMIPVVAVISSVIILDEKITWISFSGSILTLLGLYISGKKTLK